MSLRASKYNFVDGQLTTEFKLGDDSIDLRSRTACGIGLNKHLLCLVDYNGSRRCPHIRQPDTTSDVPFYCVRSLFVHLCRIIAYEADFLCLFPGLGAARIVQFDWLLPKFGCGHGVNSLSGGMLTATNRQNFFSTSGLPVPWRKAVWKELQPHL